MSDLEHAARQAADAAPTKEILSFEYDGKRHWLKRGRPTGSNILHQTVWRLSRFPLLIPVQSQSAPEARTHEINKIRRLAEAGIPVPKILLTTEEWFVMSDTGTVLRDHLYRKERNESLTLEIFHALADLHRRDFYHGGSQLRNMTWREGKVHFIDFEESFDTSIDLKILQLRDLFLLLFALAKDRIPLDYPKHIALYRQISGNDDFDRRLQAMFSRLGWLEKLIAYPPLWKILDKDTKATYRLVQEIRKL